MNVSIDKDKTWGWLKICDCTELLISAAKDRVLRTNYIKHHSDNTLDLPLFRTCEEKGKTVGHIVSKCKMLKEDGHDFETFGILL